ncbi:gamma-glutamyl-gamma-aminobutyrate hydrolase family protein [Candidatus Sumerlaeota bacterium]|nr:gamma-glutamyl-gamma-aminobutyrate hydrolase family protein [Candidatus Sumerlaeota bacterium]
MSTRPLIGINTDNFTNAGGAVTGTRPKYWRAIIEAGGTPLLIPQLADAALIEDAIAPLHGFLLIGGDDIPAERYGEKTLSTAIIMEKPREENDFALINALLKSPKPTLAVCLGFQELNVALGGKLYQDLLFDGPQSEIRHYSKDGQTPDHEIEVRGGSKLADALGASAAILVNSSHHQAVREVGRGLEITARSPDGLIEGVEVTNHPFFVGVQWHPEQILDRPPQIRLFQTLVNQAAKGL